MYEKARFRADDRFDMVAISLNGAEVLIPYQSALEIAAQLRVQAKNAARYDRVPATFWRDVDTEDLADCPRPHRTFRRSPLAPTHTYWEVASKPPLVRLSFEDRSAPFHYETAIKICVQIRRAARRAKAWAGDTARYSRMLGNLTTAEDDYRLGLN